MDIVAKFGHGADKLRFVLLKNLGLLFSEMTDSRVSEMQIEIGAAIADFDEQGFEACPKQHFCETLFFNISLSILEIVCRLQPSAEEEQTQELCLLGEWSSSLLVFIEKMWMSTTNFIQSRILLATHPGYGLIFQESTNILPIEEHVLMSKETREKLTTAKTEFPNQSPKQQWQALESLVKLFLKEAHTEKQKHDESSIVFFRLTVFCAICSHVVLFLKKASSLEFDP